jgi:hypothetical protein
MRRDGAGVLGGVSNTAFVSDAQTNLVLDALYQQREFRSHALMPEPLANQSGRC